MSIRESTVTTAPEVLGPEVTPPPERRPPTEPGSARRRALPIILALAVVAAVAVAAAVAGVLAGDSGSAVAEPAEQQPAQVPASAPLALTVDAPATAAVGERVRFAVAYTDGTGIFSGTSEEWGDGVGASSLREGVCAPTAPAAEGLSGSYRVAHRFTEPGTYSVILGVHSYTCEGGAAVTEKASTVHTLEVLAR
jgi:hypothetical protein